MFKGKLKDFQEEGKEFALSHPYHICNFEAGLGKTITSLSVACSLRCKTLVVAPAFLKNNWLREIDKFTEGLDIEVISYNKFAKNFKDYSDCKFIIMDEVHACKNHTAQRTKAAHSFLNQCRPDYFMGLSGTPVSNRISEAWSLLQMCYYGGQYPEFQPFNRLYYKFCNTFSYERTFEVNRVPIVRFDGIRNVPALKQLIAPVLLRKKTSDVIDLPKMITIDHVGNSKKYDDDLKLALELFNADPNDPHYMSIKSANAMAKASTTVSLARELIAQGHRPLIFTCHVATAEELGVALKCQVITGNVQPLARQSIIDDFNEKKSGCLVATIGSTSTGFNITSTNYTIFNDIDFVPANIEQAMKRTNRMGQDKTCFYYFVYLSEMDKSLHSIVDRKSKDIKKIYD